MLPWFLAVVAAASPAEDLSIGWEGLTAISSLVIALFAIGALLWRGGQLSNQLETAQRTAETALAELKATRSEIKTEIDDLNKKIEGLFRMVYELRGARSRKGVDDDDRG